MHITPITIAARNQIIIVISSSISIARNAIKPINAMMIPLPIIRNVFCTLHAGYSCKNACLSAFRRAFKALQQCFSPGFCIKFLLNFLLPSLFRCFRSPRLKLFTAGMAHPVIIGKSRTCSAQAAQYADRPENHHTAAGICKRSAAARMMNSHILRIFRTALWTLHAIPSPLLSYAQYIISSLICE